MCGRWMVPAAVLILFAPLLHAADPVDELDTWDDGTLGDWQDRGGEAVLANEGDYLAAQFGDQELPGYETCLAWTPIDHSVLVTNLSFAFLADPKKPSEIRVCLHSRHSDTGWQKWLPAPETGWTGYEVAVDLAEGWTIGPPTSLDAFRNDVLDIDWVGVFVVRSAATEPQTFGIDDFRVQGVRLTDIVDPPDDADGDGIPDAYEDRHDLSSAWAGDALLDKDNDGMNNYAEYRAGTDASDPLSLFTINAEARRQEAVNVGVAVKWDSVRYRSYALWKSTNLVDGFRLEQDGIFCTPPENIHLDPSATNSGPYFYRVEVEE